MTMETLQSDWKDIVTASNQLSAITTMTDLVGFLKNNLIPFVEAHVSETNEIDSCLNDLIEEAEDILQPETAKIFMACIAGGAVLVQALKAKISEKSDPSMWKAIAEWEENARAANDILEEIVIVPDSEEAEGDDEDDDDDDDELDLNDDSDEDDDDDDEEGDDE